MPPNTKSVSIPPHSLRRGQGGQGRPGEDKKETVGEKGGYESGFRINPPILGDFEFRFPRIGGWGGENRLLQEVYWTGARFQPLDDSRSTIRLVVELRTNANLRLNFSLSTILFYPFSKCPSH